MSELFPVDRNPNPVAPEIRDAILADPGFGRYFTDHIVLAEHDGKAWGPMRIGPNSTSVEVGSGAIQYGFSIFEGMKAFRSVDGHLNLFRPDMHARRFWHSACKPVELDYG